MTDPAPIRFHKEEGRDLAGEKGNLVVFADAAGKLTPGAQAVDRLTGGALGRAVADPDFKAKPGTTRTLRYPSGVAAGAVILATLGKDPDRAAARKTGGAIARALVKGDVTLATAGVADDALVAELAHALVLRLYDFRDYKTAQEENGPESTPPGKRKVHLLAADPRAARRAQARFAALAEGVFFTRDLVNEPANRLTTDAFAKRLEALGKLGVEVEVLGEAELEKLGARALLAVGQGSDSESRIVVMRWDGGRKKDAPLALIGKGVVFDTGGISMKPASGMEEMTMDMGGAGVVSGVMRVLALRKAKANVVGVVGLVENMPDARAQRPGDIVRSMKGDTIEVINTDAEGRMVLADLLWYAQERFKPAAMVDLATLTGAMVIALGHHRAGFFATDDAFAAEYAAAAEATGDEIWRMPLGKPYAEQIKSRLADIKNTGGRSAGAITAAEFLHRFVRDGVPWIHIDIAGVTLNSNGTDLAPKGASGWGVAALDELVRAKLEG
ncbi:MAG TPA: leucyl aminopeptidase [Thermohalobaculum sp.]|nr:leucyl aminopeptidase [Thermohalobaculum sp.]